MMEDAGDVKFSCGYVETKAKLKVEINEEWRRLQAEKAEAAKGGKTYFERSSCAYATRFILIIICHTTNLLQNVYIYL